LTTAEVYGEKNSFRMKPYHRLDVALNFHKKTTWGERTWSFSIYNAYNQQNPSYYGWGDEYYGRAEGAETPPMKLYQYSYFPIIPSVSYSFKF